MVPSAAEVTRGIAHLFPLGEKRDANIPRYVKIGC